MGKMRQAGTPDSPALLVKKQKRIDEIKKYGRGFQGRGEFIAILSGKSLPASRAIKAYCYDCMGYFADGAVDCGIPTCPLYKWMPYKGKEPSNSTT